MNVLNRAGGASGAFTLIELLVVMAIMGMMGTASIGAYRSMRRGMEERSVLQNASQFVRLAYQRSQVDGVPVAVYFWNELAHEETDEDPLKVFGRAVAVRRIGRFSSVTSGFLLDEFGNLDSFSAKDSAGEYDASADLSKGNAPGQFLYRVSGRETKLLRSTVSMSTKAVDAGMIRVITDDSWSGDSGTSALYAYGYQIHDKGGIDWEVGDAYGLEFAEIALPENYIFGNAYPTSASDPIKEYNQVFNFNPAASDNGGSLTLPIYALRQNESGGLVAKSLENTVAPNMRQSKQND